MAMYFFHTQTRKRVTDNEGLELPDHAAARTEAIRTAGELIRDVPEGFWSTRPWSVTVTDAAGHVLYEIFLDGVSAPDAD